MHLCYDVMKMTFCLCLSSQNFPLRIKKKSQTSYDRETSHTIFPLGSAGKESACNVGDLGLIPGLGRSPGEGKGYPFQYSGLGSSMDCIVHGVANS